MYLFMMLSFILHINKNALVFFYYDKVLSQFRVQLKLISKTRQISFDTFNLFNIHIQSTPVSYHFYWYQTVFWYLSFWLFPHFTVICPWFCSLHGYFTSTFSQSIQDRIYDNLTTNNNAPKLTFPSITFYSATLTPTDA